MRKLTNAERNAAMVGVYLLLPRHYLYSKYKVFKRFDWGQSMVEVRVLGQWDLRVTAKPVTKVHVPR